MDYTEMVRKVRSMNLESLVHGIKVHELDNPQRFEAAGLGIIKINQDYQIYSGSWESPNKKVLKTIDSSYDPCGEYYKMIKDIENRILSGNIIKPERLNKHGIIYHGENEDELYNQLMKTGINPSSGNNPVRPPIGVIHVGCDYKDSWIWNRVAFNGWNIHKYNNVQSSVIRLK